MENKAFDYNDFSRYVMKHSNVFYENLPNCNSCSICNYGSLDSNNMVMRLGFSKSPDIEYSLPQTYDIVYNNILYKIPIEIEIIGPIVPW